MDSIMYYKGKPISKLSDDEIEQIKEELRHPLICGYVGPISIMPIGELGREIVTVPQHSGISGSHRYPNEVTVDKFTLGLHICQYCQQTVYIGTQIKSIVALACPSCGAPIQ